MARIRVFLLAVLPGALAAPALADTCVENGGEEQLLFVAEAGEVRELAWLGPGETLCAAGSEAGRVAVFEDEDSLEGCTRLVPAGGRETLLRYASFDNCLWQSHLD